MKVSIKADLYPKVPDAKYITERGTVKGVMFCCHDMETAWGAFIHPDFYMKDEFLVNGRLDINFVAFATNEKKARSIMYPIKFCPWCGNEIEIVVEEWQE